VHIFFSRISSFHVVNYFKKEGDIFESNLNFRIYLYFYITEIYMYIFGMFRQSYKNPRYR